MGTRAGRWLFFGVLAFALVLSGVVRAWAQGQAASSEVLVLTLDGPITPVTVRYLTRGLETAQSRGSQVVVFQLNTPGGTVDAMQRMVEAIRNSPVPVVVYVAPRGATAASAGSLVLLAAHVAAMAPETTLGAATPVGSSGEDLDPTMQKKATNLLKAMARSLAQRRGEKAMEVAQRLVEEAYALPAEEALSIGLIDIVARDLDDLLAQLDGRRVETVAGEVMLHTARAGVYALSLNVLEALLQVLTNPNVVFILLLLGIQLIYVEISHPGGWVPGFLGVLFLGLALYGLGALPVNWFGLLLILLAFVLFVLELKNPGFQGGLIVAGTLSFIAGALLLFNTPRALPFQRVSVPLVLGLALVMAAVTFGIMTLAVRAQRRPIVMGPERWQQDLVGRRALVRTRITETEPGTVHVAGELWTATVPPGTPPVDPNTWVEVIAVEKGHLVVRPV